MAFKVEEYIRDDASNPYKHWFDGLSSQAAAKVTVAKLRMELGNTSSIKWFDGLGEYVIDWGPGYRIYLAKDGKQYRRVAQDSAGNRDTLALAAG